MVGCDENLLIFLLQTEVCLTLTNKFTLPPVDRGDMDRLFIKTKQLLCSVLPCTAFGQGMLHFFSIKTIKMMYESDPRFHI